MTNSVSSGLRILALASALAALGACGGGKGGGSSGSGGGSAAAPAPAVPTVVAVVPADAARLAKQASFGATPALIDRIVALNVSGWLDEQFAATGSSYADYAADAVVRNFCVNDNNCTRRHFSREPVAMRFYANAVTQPDQLRQRVALALSQLLVASDVEVQSTAGLAAFNQIFLSNAFGNYRDILLAVTMSGYMGDYLDMADSNRTSPSENYAREMLQLFSMGPDALGPDGNPIRDATGGTQPNYTADDIKAVARALTGWTYARVGGAPVTDGNARDHSKPMVTAATRYDSAEKRFLGVTVPAGATQDESIRITVDAAFNRPSTAPFVAKFLIQHLVTANPAPAYVARVAGAFANNGANVRGDMRAVVRAILTDVEARGSARSGATDGKVKDPILLMTALARAIGFQTDGYAFTARDTALGQAAFRNPSVFNFYPPDYPLAQSATLKSPASKLMTTGGVLQRHNFIYQWTIEGDQARGEFAVQAAIPGSTGSRTDWSAWEALGADGEALIDRIDLILLNRTMTAAQKQSLRTVIAAITNGDPALQARRRAQTALYVVASSPQFQVDR